MDEGMALANEAKWAYRKGEQERWLQQEVGSPRPCYLAPSPAGHSRANAARHDLIVQASGHPFELPSERGATCLAMVDTKPDRAVLSAGGAPCWRILTIGRRGAGKRAGP